MSFQRTGSSVSQENLQQQIGRYAAIHGGQPLALWLDRWRHLVQVELARFGDYRRLAGWRHRRCIRQHPWFTADLTALWQLPAPEPAQRLDAVLRRAIGRYPLPLYLRVEDRNSMAHSIEARLPFLDYRLVEWLFQLPPDWHLRGPWNKYVLREGLRGRIPEVVRTRTNKMGFPVPGQRWLGETLAEPVRDLFIRTVGTAAGT